MERQDIIAGLDGQEQQNDEYEYNGSERKQGGKGKGGRNSNQSSKYNYSLMRENDGRDISNSTWSKEQDMSSIQLDSDHPKHLSELSSSLSSKNIFSERKSNNHQEYAKFDYHKTSQDSCSSQMNNQNVDFEVLESKERNVGSDQHKINHEESKQRCLNTVRSNSSINNSSNSMNISQYSQQQYTSQQQNKRFFREQQQQQTQKQQQQQQQRDQVGVLQNSNSKLKVRLKTQEKDEDQEDQVLHAAATKKWEKNTASVHPIISVEKQIHIEDIVKVEVEKALEKLLRKERKDTEKALQEIKQDFRKQLDYLGQKLSENTVMSCQAVDKKLELFLEQYTLTKNNLTEELDAIKVREIQIQKELMELADKFKENQVYASLLEKSENSKFQKTPISDVITTTGTSIEEPKNSNNQSHKQEDYYINRNNENQQELIDQDQDLQVQGLITNNVGIIAQPQSQTSLSQQSALIQSNSSPSGASKRGISILPMTHSSSSPSMFSISSNLHNAIQPQHQQLQQDQQQQQQLLQHEQQQQFQSNQIDYESFSSSQPQSSWIIPQQPIIVNAIHKSPYDIQNPNNQLILPFPEEPYQHQQEKEHPMIIVHSPQKQQQLLYNQNNSFVLQPTASPPPVIIQTSPWKQNQPNQPMMVFQQNINNPNYQQIFPQQQYSTQAQQTSLVNTHIQSNNFQPSQVPQIQQLNPHPNYYYSLNNNMSNNNQSTLSSRFAELSHDQEEFHRQVDSYLADRKIPGKLSEILGNNKDENNKRSGQNNLSLDDIKTKYLTNGRHGSRHSSTSSVQSSENADQVELELDSFKNNIEEHNGQSIYNNNTNMNVQSQLQVARDAANTEVIVPMNSQKNLFSHQLAAISEQDNEDEFILYQMDERGNLLDEHGRYIVDAVGGHVVFSQNQINQLRQQNLLEDL